MKMTKYVRETNVPALHMAISLDVKWIGVHTCLTDAYKTEAHKILTEAGYTKGDQLFMATHIDPGMAHYRYYHPHIIEKNSTPAK